MENMAIWVLVGDTLLGTLIFIGFALAVKGLAGEMEIETPLITPTEAPRVAEHKA
ncbi:MAG: hypothetical protein HZC40_05005 [Chloroflexi bacterium]|nr:hypothetical protein [Chloroflexota bacterium]